MPYPRKSVNYGTKSLKLHFLFLNIFWIFFFSFEGAVHNGVRHFYTIPSPRGVCVINRKSLPPLHVKQRGTTGCDCHSLGTLSLWSAEFRESLYILLKVYHSDLHKPSARGCPPPRLFVFDLDDLIFARGTLCFLERLDDFLFNALLKSNFGSQEKIKLDRNVKIS